MATNNAVNEATAASGTVLQGQGVGTASAFSTATYPSTATGTGTILRADGTNWSATTATYPNTTTINQVLYSSAANVVSGLATANSAVLATSSSGVPSLTATPTITSVTFGTGNALNTYVTATWTPNIQINSSNTGITYTNQLGGYTRIGNVVTIWAYILLSSKGASVGNVTISNLPVQTAGNGNLQQISVQQFQGWTFANYTTMSLNLAGSSTVGTFSVSGSGQAFALVSNTQITNTFLVNLVGSYIID